MTMLQNDILDIPNRTENWKTARAFIPIIEYHCQHELASRIIQHANGVHIPLRATQVILEVFWKGFRDYCKRKGNAKPNPEEVAVLYRELFSKLPEQICDYNDNASTNKAKLKQLKPGNYVCFNDSTQALYANLLNTEIDIVLSTPGYLLIGEAKHVETFGADSRLVLVHQLIRQYVVASIIVNMVAQDNNSELKEEIIPFIICDDPVQTKKSAQIKFLQHLGWINMENVFSWNEIHRITKEGCE